MSSTTAAAVEGTAESLAGFGQVDNTMSSTIAASTNKEATSITGSLITSTLGNFVESSLKAIISSTTAAPTAAINPTTATTSSSSTSTSIRAETTFTMPTSTTTFSSMLTSGHATESSTTKAATMQNVADLSSSLQHFGIIDYLVFVLMLIVCAVIGFYFGFVEKKKKKKRNIEQRRGSEALDYLVGGRKMKVFPVSLSLVASFVSGISLLGTSTEIYVYGTQYAFILLTLAISGVISWYVFLPVFCNLQLTSTYEYFERRFSHRMRLFGATLFTLKAIIWLPIAIYVPALTFNQVSGIGVHTITPIVITICTFYTTVGGIRGVVWTDVLQSFVMFGSIIVLMIKGTYDLGGIDIVWQRVAAGGRFNAPELTLDPTVRLSILSVLIGGTFFKIQSIAINQTTIQRFMSLPTLDKVRKTLIGFSIGLTLLILSCIYVGLLTYATYHDCDPMSTGVCNFCVCPKQQDVTQFSLLQLAKAHDQLVPLLVMRVLGVFPGLPGLFVAGVFSAALSSLSTLLNSLSAVILEDFVKPHVHKPLSERATAFIMRAVVVIFGMSSIALVFVVEKLGMVLQLSATLQSIIYGPMLGTFASGMLMPWINEKSALTGSIVSFLCMAWICINAQVATYTGSFRHTMLPVSIEGCEYDFDMSRYLNSTSEYEPKHGTAIYHISFLWYTTLGTVLCVIVSNLACLIFGTNKIEEFDENLLAPFVVRLLKKRNYKSVNLSEELEQTTKLNTLSNGLIKHDQTGL